MKAILLATMLVLAVASCSTPVLRKDLLDQGQRNVAPARIVNNPSFYMGKLFILGGMIVSTTLISDGSMIEAVYIPVNKNGDLRETDSSAGRFVAFYPKEKGVLDPLMYREGRKITVAGIFTDLRSGRIGEMTYVFPVFRIEQLYLWDEFARAYPTTFFNFGFFGVFR